MKLKGFRIQRCMSFLSKMKGFMFSLSKNKAKVFVFEDESARGIHMLFVFMPLIAVWLDEGKRVNDFRLMKPFISRHSAMARFVVEMPFNKKSRQIFRKLKKGMKIEF